MSNFTYSRTGGNVVISYGKSCGGIGIATGAKGQPQMFPGGKATVPNSQFTDGTMYVIGAYANSSGGTPIETDNYIAHPNGTVQVAAGSGWQNLPAFKALSTSDQAMFLNYVNYDNGQLPSTRDASCNTIVTNDIFTDTTIQPALLGGIRLGPNQAINAISTFITTASFTAPDLSRMSNKDVKNAQCCFLWIFGWISKCLIGAGSADVKTILTNTLDAYRTAETVQMVLVDATDPTVAAHSKVGDIVYPDRRIGINTAGFGITATGISDGLDMVCTMAHGYGHWLRAPYHTAHPTAANSIEHFTDELVAYFTEFTVRWNTSGHADGDDMDKAITALNNAPYTYADATGDVQKAIQALSSTVRSKGVDPSSARPDGTNWNYLNNSPGS